MVTFQSVIRKESLLKETAEEGENFQKQYPKQSFRNK